MFNLNISCTFEIILLEKKKKTSPNKRKGKFWELAKTE